MFTLEFLEIESIDGKLTHYPEEEGLEFILKTNSGEYIHCISIETLEDTPCGSEYMITVVPFNEDNYTHFEFEHCSHIAYLDKSSYTVSIDWN